MANNWKPLQNLVRKQLAQGQMQAVPKQRAKEPCTKPHADPYPAVAVVLSELTEAAWEREYAFLSKARAAELDMQPRRFRFDYACPALKLAVEVEGGVWTQGRHTRGKGYVSDMEKYNLAQALGWRVCRITSAQARSYKQCLAVLKSFV